MWETPVTWLWGRSADHLKSDRITRRPVNLRSIRSRFKNRGLVGTYSHPVYTIRGSFWEGTPSDPAWGARFKKHTHVQSLKTMVAVRPIPLFFAVNWFESTYSRDKRRTCQLSFPATSKLTDVSRDVWVPVAAAIVFKVIEEDQWACPRGNQA